MIGQPDGQEIKDFAVGFRAVGGIKAKIHQIVDELVVAFVVGVQFGVGDRLHELLFRLEMVACVFKEFGKDPVKIFRMNRVFPAAAFKQLVSEREKFPVLLVYPLNADTKRFIPVESVHFYKNHPD